MRGDSRHGNIFLCGLLVPCSLPGPPVVSVFSSLLPGKGVPSLPTPARILLSQRTEISAKEMTN